MSDLRLVNMFLDNQTPGDWTVRERVLYKGDSIITGNPKILSGLATYIRPDTRLSFHIGKIPINVESLKFHDSDPIMRLVFLLKKDDTRLNPQFRDPGQPGANMQSRATYEIYILPGGILSAVKSAAGMNVGWIQLERDSLGQGMLENWAFKIFLATVLLIASIILFIAYRIIFKLSEPVSRLVKINKDIMVAKKHLEDISRRDPLTGLLNRRGLDLSFNELEFFSDGKHATVALLDLDDFKKINDTYGHNCGDYALNEVSRLIKNGIRQKDIACRWGGEEFLIVYSGAEDNLLTEITERIRRSIANFSYLFEGQGFALTVTIGFSPCMEASDFNACVKRADEALYRGKKEGKNRVVRS